MRACLGYEAVSAVAARGALGAARSAIDGLLRSTGGRAGLVVVAPDGEVGIAHSTPRMAYGVRRAGAARCVSIGLVPRALASPAPFKGDGPPKT